MPSRTSHRCTQREVTVALAEEQLYGDQRRAAQRHLQECVSCRTLFRHRTSKRLPRFRSYTSLERIGEGGFGVVYKVIHHAKERIEALKVLFAKTPIRAAYFQNEVHLIAKLRHPNIATLYEAHLGTPSYYTMEFVEGLQLDDYFSSRHVSLADRIRLVRAVASAVGYAHSQGVIHRDIKPQNILVDAGGQPRIVDFGIAKKVEPVQAEEDEQPRSPEGVLGTFGYIAPEQAAGEQVDERADIYALGALLYHCVTGESAKSATGSQRVRQLLRDRQVTRAEDLAAIIGRCVDPLPERRYASCALLIADLQNYLLGRRVRARPDPSPVYRVEGAAVFVLRSHPLIVRAFIAAGAALLLTLLSWQAEARWLVAGAETPAMAMAVFTEQTKQAIASGRLGDDLIGQDVEDTKVWRVAHGRLLQRLVEAEPHVVVCDYSVAICQPQFDRELINGLEALREAGVPVVIGASRLDINGEPVVCPRVLAAVHSCGTMASPNPDMRLNEWIVPICVQRGFARPVPGLAVAAFAAARHPDADLDLLVRARSNVVVLRYRKRNVRSGESAWYPDIDQMGYAKPDRARGDDLLQPGDRVFPMHVPADDADVATVTVPLEEVVEADSEQLRRWFRGRVVVVGHFLPIDEFETASQERIYGCEVQAGAIQSLLSGARLARFDRRTLLGTILTWCALAAVGVGLTPVRRMLVLRGLTWVCLLGFVGGVLVISLGARWVTDFWGCQVVLALGTLLTAGSPAYLAKALRARQMLEPSWSAEEETISSTLLASAAGPAVPVPPDEPACSKAAPSSGRVPPRRMSNGC